ncbi:MAG: beta-ketoacyl-[acyl-carrier-protein] synthase family protein [Deltaproteobacteria bacterium]|nr:beta-ketoacyl-[acyl-carrier-protein] synthase family protein [Deltaproteobacteria bacterium]
MERRVVITGLGLISPLGIGKESFWQSLVEGRSGVRRLTRFDPEGYACQVAGEIPDESYRDLIESKRRRRMTHVAQLAVAGAQMALTDAGLSPCWLNPYTAGVIVGTSVGSLKDGVEQQSILLERGASRINPFLTVSLHINAISAEVALTARTQGLAFTVAGGCASSLCAISVAADMIRSGTLDVCLTGGAESPLFPLTFASLCRTQELTTLNEAPEQASRPFDRAHNGLVVSEGSCILVLEERARAERRGAPIYGEILGYALGCEAYEAFGLEPSGESAAHTLQEALTRACIAPTEIEWVNAHGSSCPSWDRKETRILKKALGEAAYSIPISATKSVMGHTFGAAAAFQVASAVLAMQSGLLPPTINLDMPDPECDLDYVPRQARALAPRLCLINSFAYGGINSFLLLRKG